MLKAKLGHTIKIICNSPWLANHDEESFELMRPALYLNITFRPHSARRGVLNEDKKRPWDRETVQLASCRFRRYLQTQLYGRCLYLRLGRERSGVSIKSVRSVRATGIYAR